MHMRSRIHAYAEQDSCICGAGFMHSAIQALSAAMHMILPKDQ